MMDKPQAHAADWHSAGCAALAQGKYERALHSFHRELELNGPHSDLYRQIAAAWTHLQRPAKAVESLLKAMVLAPSDDGTILDRLGRLCRVHPNGLRIGPEQWLAVVDDMDPGGPFSRMSAEFAGAMADRLQGTGKLSWALDFCLTSHILAPNDLQHALRAGDLLWRMRRLGEGRKLLERFAAANPSARVFHQLAEFCQEMLDFDVAKQSYQQALKCEPDYVPSRCALGHLLQEQCMMREAECHLRRAHELSPDPLVRILIETSTTPIPLSRQELCESRQRIEDNLARLVEEQLTIDPTIRPVPTTFYTAFHGLNDRHIAECFGRIYRTCESKPCEVRPNASSRRLRIGILSRYFRDHTIGRLNLGTVQHISRERFEVVVVTTRQPVDPMARQFLNAADQYVVLSHQPSEAWQQLRTLQLDVLFFADVGMDPLTYSLAFARSAPIQCVTWGHPVTTGSSEMDYFVSSERLEVPDAQSHYTEQLVRLPDLAVCYARPTVAVNTRNRQDFGLPTVGHLYGCLQTLFKLHPDFDELVASILDQDVEGTLVLIEGRHPSWTERMRSRLAAQLGPAIRRVLFLPKLAWTDYMAVTQCMDVLLDPIHFGGGNSSYEAFAAGTPVVSWPGQFLRNRITAALYQQMGIVDCLAESAAEYVNVALRLATNREYRHHVHSRILEANHVLYGVLGGIRQLETFWETAILARANRS